MPLRLVSIGLAAWLLAACSCGGGGSVGNPDAGDVRQTRLVVLDPPGDSLGLAFGERITLRVRYQYDDGEPIADQQVEFAILESATGDPGGSTLNARTGPTDSQGIARVDLTAGAVRAAFRVEARAEGAAPVFFYVSVSETGFAELVVAPTHEGAREATAFERVEVRLYQATTVSCATLDIDDTPTSVFPPFSMSGFDSTVRFRNVSAATGYTLVAWALLPNNTTRIATGCVDLAEALIAPGTRRVGIAVADRPASLPSSVVLRSAFDMSPLADAVAASGADATWNTLACPAGPGQLLLDCTLDLLEPDGDLDCVVTATSQLITDVEAARGAPDTGGCRPLVDGTNADSLDQELTAAVIAGDSFPSDSDLADMLAVRAGALSLFELESTVAFETGATLRHRLTRLVLRISGQTHAIDLGETSRPVLERSPVGFRVDSYGELAIDSHDFTLRYGAAARDAFIELGLAPLGLDDREADLGSALAGSATDANSSTSGCDAVSAILCDRIGQAQSCAVTACQNATVFLDSELRRWWQSLDPAGADLTLDGVAPVYDLDDDLVIDAIGNMGGPAEQGVWSASFATEDQPVATEGSFSATTVIAGPPD